MYDPTHWTKKEPPLNVRPDSLDEEGAIIQCMTDSLGEEGAIIQCKTRLTGRRRSHHSVLDRTHWTKKEPSFSVRPDSLDEEGVVIQCKTRLTGRRGSHHLV